MNHFIKAFLVLLCLSTILLSGCSTNQLKQSQILIKQPPKQRIAQLNQLRHWKIQGKIAFLQEKNRDSFSLIWQVNEDDKTQQLNLTSFLGINALQLYSSNDYHKIQVDGKTYQGRDLEELIHSLTGLTLPSNALSYWLKGIPYKENDAIIYHEQSKLPQSLTSHYNNQLWQVSYSSYQPINGYNLATKFSIKKEDLVIKIAINEWSIH